jgi:sarcosine oxidase subunit gamma
MADTLERTSPLQPWAARFTQLPDSVAIVEEPFTTMVELRADPAGPGATAAASLLGVELPTTPSTYANSADTAVIWLGPDEWLVTGTSLTGPELEARLRDAVSSHGGAAVDVSGQRTTLRLRGTNCRDVLAKGCAIDLHPSAFGGGAAAQTTLSRAGVILLAVDTRRADYRILVRSSFARYLADWLLDAAEEYSQISPVSTKMMQQRQCP